MSWPSSASCGVFRCYRTIPMKIWVKLCFQMDIVMVNSLLCVFTDENFFMLHVLLVTQIISTGICDCYWISLSLFFLWSFCQLFQVLLVFTTMVETQWSTVSSIYCKDMPPNVYRPHSVTITEFGAVGDGVTLNTKAFQNAIFYLNSFADKGGAQLFVPAGRWLTGSFNLISHLTLSLDKDAVIIGSPVRWFAHFAQR